MARRALLFAVVAPFSAVVFVLLLADRAPGYTMGKLRAVWSVGSRLQQRLGVDIVDKGDLPVSPDQLGHFGIWIVAGWLTTLLLADRFRIRWIGLGLFVLSASSEVGQHYATSGRSMELADEIANMVGIAAGLIAGVATFALLSLGSRLTAQSRTLTG